MILDGDGELDWSALPVCTDVRIRDRRQADRASSRLPPRPVFTTPSTTTLPIAGLRVDGFDHCCSMLARLRFRRSARSPPARTAAPCRVKASYSLRSTLHSVRCRWQVAC